MIQFSIRRPIKQLELCKDRDYTYAQLGKSMRLDARTVSAFMDGSVTRIDLPSLDKVLQFFAREGMPITPNDLFVIEDAPDDQA